MKIEGKIKLDDGGELSYTDYSGTGIPIILIHGFPLDQRIWKSQVEELGKAGRRVITYDMRGFGKSSDPTKPYSHEDDLMKLTEELSIEKCQLVGMSFGGEIATSFTLSNPTKVEELTLIGAGINGYKQTEQAPFGKWAQMVKDEEGKLDQAKLDQVKDELLNYGELGKIKELEKSKEMYGEISEIVKGYGGYMFLGDQRIYPDPPSITRLGEIKCKTNVVIGLNDSFDSLEQSKELATKIPNANLEVVKDVGHFVNMEKPEIVNQIIIGSENIKEKELISIKDEGMKGLGGLHGMDGAEGMKI